MRPVFPSRALPALALSLLVPGSALAFESEIAIMVPMRDGVHLATDVYRPSRNGQYPTIFVRSTYGTDFVPDQAAQIICDGLGFALVMQDTRGRYESEGVDDVFMSDGWGERQDGYDTLEWMVGQAWSDGNVGMIGASALGITAYLAIGALHPSLKAAHIGIAPWVFYDTVYPGGTFRRSLVESWLEDQDASYMLDLYYDHPVYDYEWAALDMRDRESDITVPILHWGGWHDIFTEGPVQGFAALQNGGPLGLAGPQQLIMGPWTHMDGGAFNPRQGEITYPNNSVFPMGAANPIAYFEEHLKGNPRPSTQPAGWPARYYVMGDPDQNDGVSNTWELAKSWPVPADDRLLYLQPDQTLAWVPPLDVADPLSYRYDPASPSQTIGGRELYLPAGPRDQSPLETRSDVLVFESAPLDRPQKVVGSITGVLWASSDAYDTDFVVRLNDVYPDGRAMLVTDNVLKARYRDDMLAPEFLTPGEVVELEIDLNVTAQVFGKGHRIQVMVSSSNYPRFEPSKNTQDEVWGDVPAVVATNRIYADAHYPSHIVLPEPRPGETRPAPELAPPTSRQIAQAKARSARHLKLTALQQRALRYEAGRMLMEIAYGR